MKKSLFGVYIILMIFFAMACKNDISSDKEKNYFHVTFDTNCEIELDGQEIEEGKTAKEPSSITKVGYIFDGWYNKDKIFDFATPITSSLTLSAKWNPITYTVVFDKNGGSGDDMENASCFYDEEKVLPLNTYIAPVGMRFVGWSTQKDSLSSNYSDGQKIKNLTTDNNAKIILFAIWSEKDEHSIIYQNILFDGELINNSENPISFYESKNIELKNIERKGYDFEGWFEDSNFSGSAITGWKAGEKQSNVTLYAKWKIIPYKVSYQTEYGTVPETIMVIPNTVITESQLPVLYSDEKKFSGWFDGDIKVIAESYIVTKDVTLIAKWTDIKYTVSFNSNGGTFVSSDTVIRNNKATKPDNPQKTAIISKSYIFEGWFTSEDNGTTLSDTPFDFNNTKITTDIILYAKWSEIPITYIITFNSTGGSKVLDQSVIGGDKVVKPNNPSKNATLSTEYTFLNWYTSSDNGNTLSNQPFDFDTIITDNLTLFAKWAENPITYLVTFYPNNGNETITQTIRGGDKAELPSNVSKSDTETLCYRLKGWYESADNGLTLSAQSFDFDNTIIVSDTVLYASWQEIPIYTITFNSSGGSDVATQIIETGNVASKPIKPRKEKTTTHCYVFAGWYTSEDDGATLSSNEFDFENTAINENISLYAKWNEVALYQFHSTITSYGSVSHYSKEYVLVYFGDWPQTVKAENVTVDESESLIMGAHTYYLGDDGNYYAKCIENAYTDYSRCKYSDGSCVSKITANKTKYFKVEPIKWRIIGNWTNSYTVVLLAENIITANIPVYTGNENRWINSSTVDPNNYKYSTIRAYLNGRYEEGDTQEHIYSDKGFLQTAFTAQAENSILQTGYENNEQSSKATKDSSKEKNKFVINESLTDKIFLLSTKEATTKAYGFEEMAHSCLSRQYKPTDFAIANYAELDDTTEYEFGYCFLRSPHRTSAYMQRIDGKGGILITSTNSQNIGIVPALRVSASLIE